MRCGRTLTASRIRRAYKKKALELHPDRNLNDVENATKRFAEVQTAYEILSDPQERAWYDSHRDAILNGEDDVADTAPTDQSRSGHTSANAIFALMSRFSSSVPMDDSTRGFFGILNAFFDQLAAEETAACDYAGIVSTEYPPFGGASDDYNAVAKRFYSVWSSFSTKKTFSWRDKYRLQDAPDRQIRRLMQKENQKLRDEGIREFNDAVRSLVAFVRKRDPRYVPNKQSEEERQQVLRNSTAAQAARSRAANQEKLAEYVLPEWAQSRDNDEDHGEFSLSEEDEVIEEIECVVCNKTFRSEKQFEAHEKSKKHIKAVQQLRRQMQKENANLDLQDSEPVMSPSPTARAQPGEDDTPDAVISAHHGDYDERIEDARSITGQEDTNHGTPSQPDSEDDDYAPRSEVEERISNGPHTGTKSTNTGLSTPDAMESAAASLDGLTLGNGKDEGRKVGKAKLKREKKAARQAAEAQASVSIQQLLQSNTRPLHRVDADL
jgi:DnaJ family protein A protein 5